MLGSSAVRVARAVSRRTFGSMNVFDRAVKKEQRNAAARNPYLLEDYEYLRDEVASRLIDRLDDFARELPVALDLGCHSGNIHRALLDGDDASWVKGGITTLTQCDSSPAMLELAKESAAKIGHEGVKVHSLVADEELLPFADDTFDVVLSSMSMHWVNDLPGTLTQIKNTLKPDGVFVGVMLGGETLNELRGALVIAEQEREGGVSPHISPFAGVADCGMLLQRAGFSLPAVDTDYIHIDYPDAFVLMEHLASMGENCANLHKKPFTSRDTLLAAAIAYQGMYGNADGSIPVTYQLNYFLGWKPDASQPKPKKRGSVPKGLAAPKVLSSLEGLEGAAK